MGDLATLKEEELAFLEKLEKNYTLPKNVLLLQI